MVLLPVTTIGSLSFSRHFTVCNKLIWVLTPRSSQMQILGQEGSWPLIGHSVPPTDSGATQCSDH